VNHNQRNENTMRLPIWMLLSFIFALLLSGCMATEPSDPVSKMSAGDSGLVVTPPPTSSGETQICMTGRTFNSGGSVLPWSWGLTLTLSTRDSLVLPLDTSVCRGLGKWKLVDIRMYSVSRTGNIKKAWTIEGADTVDVTELAKRGVWP
jgi:hypothetical protein